MRTVFAVGQKYGMLTIIEKQGYDKQECHGNEAPNNKHRLKK